jgi:hypothetical protein
MTLHPAHGVATVLVAFAAISVSPPATPHSSPRQTTIKARVVTGTNRFLGAPQTDLGAPYGTAGFENVAAYNPNGSEPVPLTPRTRQSAQLATFVDPDFLSLIGRTPADVNPETINVRINDVPINVSPAGDQRIPVKSEPDASPGEPSHVPPGQHIRLSDWTRAQGTASIRCEGNSAHVVLNLSDLIPNRLYSVWAILGDEAGLAPLPLGGVPNAVVTSSSGYARFSRTLNYCPTDRIPEDRPLLLIDVVLHSDYQLYGAVPDLPLAGLYTGIINHTHLEFPIRGRPARER